MDTQQNPWWYHVLSRDDAEPLSLTQGQVFTFGRHESNDVRISSRKASRKHASIEWTGSQAKLVDLGSNNGSYVNDRRVNNHVLKDGDEIRIATFVCIYRKVHDLLELEVESEQGALTTAGNNSMFSGHIHKTPVVEVLTKLAQDGTTGVLNLLPKLGQVGIKQGEPVFAFANQLSGEAALLQLLLLEKGMYIFSPQPLGPKAANVSRPLAQILASAIGRGVKPVQPPRPSGPIPRPTKPGISPPPRPSSFNRARRSTSRQNPSSPAGPGAPGVGPNGPARHARPPRQSASIRKRLRPSGPQKQINPLSRPNKPKSE